MNEMLKQLDELQTECEELLQRKITPDEAKLIGLVFEKGKIFGMMSTIKDIQNISK